jgi:hypothetical protein
MKRQTDKERQNQASVMFQTIIIKFFQTLADNKIEENRKEKR